MGVDCHQISNGSEIGRIMQYLVDRGTDLEIRIREENVMYLSRLLKVISDDGSLAEHKRKALLLERLNPDIGNGQIQQAPEVEVAFWFYKYVCRFHSAHMRMSANSHPSGLMIHFPSSVELEEKRLELRTYLEFPKFYSAVFKLPLDDRGEGEHEVELNILNYSNYGLGLLVRKEELPMLKRLRSGDRIPNILLFGEGMLVKLEGIVRHKTEILGGQYCGDFLLGLESDERIEHHFDGSDSPAS